MRRAGLNGPEGGKWGARPKRGKKKKRKRKRAGLEEGFRPDGVLGKEKAFPFSWNLNLNEFQIQTKTKVDQNLKTNQIKHRNAYSEVLMQI